MVNFFIVHGTEGSFNSNWFPWLKSELEKKGFEVIVPDFPTPKGQSLSNWLNVFDNYKDKVNSETIFVGHSLGPAFILSFLERLENSVNACFFVAGFLDSLGNEHFDSLNKSFVDKKFDWEKIRSNCGRFFIINSKDDPYVPIDKGKRLADKVGGEFFELENAGHINSEYGYTKFPFLLDKIWELVC